MPEVGGPITEATDPSSDLSAGTVAPSEQQKLTIGLSEFNHRVNQQLNVSSAAIRLAVLLFGCAIAIGACFVYALVAKEMDLSWHATILVAAFVVPPTILISSLLRAVFQPKEKDEDSTVPALAFLKELASAIAAAWKAAKGGQ